MNSSTNRNLSSYTTNFPADPPYPQELSLRRQSLLVKHHASLLNASSFSNIPTTFLTIYDLINDAKSRGYEATRTLKELVSTTTVDEDGNERGLSFLTIKKSYFSKNCPELLPKARIKKPTMKELVLAMKHKKLPGMAFFVCARPPKKIAAAIFFFCLLEHF